jgi:bifunctional non-homologous end joining protein LigD
MLPNFTLMPPKFTPMPLAVAREPFDHPDWVYEVKWDGFPALAYIDRHHCRLLKCWPTDR